jgi:hypothetical protein
MSTRLQVVLERAELREIRAAARRQRMTVSEWVRQALRNARRQQPRTTVTQKLDALRAASKYALPVSDVDGMNRDIARGYLKSRAR